MPQPTEHKASLLDIAFGACLLIAGTLCVLADELPQGAFESLALFALAVLVLRRHT